MHRIASIPARINIIGEHTDYAGGLSFAFAAPQRLTLKATAIQDGVEGERTVVSLWKEANGWPAQLSVSSEIPLGAGMSSSAALCLAIVLCVNKDIDAFQACREAQRIEHVVLGTKCGLLDQMAMMFSKPNHAVLINFTDYTTTQHPLSESHVFKLIDSGIHRTLGEVDYRTSADEQTKRIHVGEENERVIKSIEASAVELGLLLNASHESLRTIGVSLEEVDEQVTALQNTPGVLGARMMGGGFGGMILVLVEHEEILPKAVHVQASEAGFVEEFL
jgi:galactokinase